MNMKHWLSPLAVLALVALPLAAETGHLRIRSSPVGAGLFVDGKYVGPAGRFSVPEKWPVEAGSHEITLKDPRYEDFSAKVDVKSGKTTKLRAKLKKLEEPKGPFGRLRLKGGEPESFWSVAQGDTGPFYLNGKYMGHVDELNDIGGGLLVPAGTYELMVESQLFGTIKKSVTIVAGKLNAVPYGGKKEQ